MQFTVKESINFTFYNIEFSLCFIIEEHNIVGVNVTVDYLFLINTEYHLINFILKPNINVKTPNMMLFFFFFC